VNKNEKAESLAEWFVGLTADEQVRFLTGLAHELTVVARDFYVPQGTDLTDGTAVRLLNEIQHRVTAHARNILDDPAEGSHPAAYGFLDDVPARSDLLGLVRLAIEHARRRVEPQAANT